MYAVKSYILGCDLGGAIGDAFGASIEHIRSIKKLQNLHGKNGLQNFAYHKSPWDDSEQEGVGLITDDTTMKACTAAAIIETKRLRRRDFENVALDKMYDYYMAWGMQQKHGHVISKAIDYKIKTPGYLSPFLFRCGAGLNTLAALATGERGDIDKPVQYDCKIDKRQVKGPNKGCGAMMRVAPISFLYDELDIISFSARSAAITHGDLDAIAATSATAVLIANALKCDNLKKALKETRKDFEKIPNNKGIIQSWDLAEEAFKKNKVDMVTMSALGQKQGKNPFLALPVLTQTLYVVHVASKVRNPQPNDFKDAIRLAANHTGDSDSVASIVGNVLGAHWGHEILPRDWVEQVQQKDDVLSLGLLYYKTARDQKLGL